MAIPQKTQQQRLRRVEGGEAAHAAMLQKVQ